ncbi:glycosyltransferase [soil metagenome]
MRILIITKYFPPENSVASLRPYSWARYWTEAGHEVEVLTTVKDRSRPESSEMPNNGFAVHEVDFPPIYQRMKGLYKKFVKSNPQASSGQEPVFQSSGSGEAGPARRPGILKRLAGRANDFRLRRGVMLAIRMPDNFDFWVKEGLKWTTGRRPWDLVISTHAPYATHLIAERLKREGLAGTWVADFRDLWTDNHIYKGLFPFTVAEQYLERRAMKTADAITTVSEPLAQTLARKYGAEKVFVVENGYDAASLDGLPATPAFPADGKKRIIHTGTIYQDKQDPSLLFRAMADLAREPAGKKLLGHLEVVFVGSNADVLQEMVRQHGVVEWVKLGGFLPRTEVLRMQRDAHALLFLEFDGGKTAGILTGKLFEYLSSGTQVWGVGVQAHSSPGMLINLTQSGILFGDDQEHLRQELMRLLQEKSKRAIAPAEEVLQRFERKVLAHKLLQILPGNE